MNHKKPSRSFAKLREDLGYDAGSPDHLTSLSPILYKYRTWTNEYHRSVLTKGTLFFASPSFLNDPFEISSYIKDEEWWLPDGKNEELLADLSYRERGIVSLSARHDDLLMWSHYGDSHRGICVGFDTDRLLKCMIRRFSSADKFAAKSGANRVALLVFHSGKIHVEGAESDLKKWPEEVKQSIEAGTGAPGILLPAEIEKFPQTLYERVPACDDVVLWFYQEALRCYKAGSPAGAAFMQTVLQECDSATDRAGARSRP